MLKPQVRHLSGVPRAMFEACSARPPVALPFRAASLTQGEPNHRCGDKPAPHGMTPRRHRPSSVPSGARRARRDRAASAARLRVCVLHPNRATAPDPHFKTPHEAPLMDRDRNIIRLPCGDAATQMCSLCDFILCDLFLTTSRISPLLSGRDTSRAIAPTEPGPCHATRPRNPALALLRPA
jgi:hypothetical protein